MAGKIKKKKSAYGKRGKKKSKTYDAYMVVMAAPAEAAVGIDVHDVVVAAAIVEVPPRSCIDIFTVLPPEDTSRLQAGKILVRSRRVTALMPRLPLMLMCPMLSWLLPLLRYRPAPASIFLQCCHQRILAAPRAGRLLVWSRRVTTRSPKRSPSN